MDREQEIKNDATKWSGLPAELVSDLVDRKYDSLEHEIFKLLGFKSAQNLHWYYRVSPLYLFQTISHPHWPLLDKVEKGPVLDYGGGCGNNFFWLLDKGFEVDYFDIGYACVDYVKWKIRHKGYTDFKCRIIDPFHGAHFDPISCISGRTYGAIIFQSVLEHIHDYESLLIKAINSLYYEGLIFEEAPFGNGGDSYHLKEKKTISQIMLYHGMVNVCKNVWRKKKGG